MHPWKQVCQDRIAHHGTDTNGKALGVWSVHTVHAGLWIRARVWSTCSCFFCSACLIPVLYKGEKSTGLGSGARSSCTLVTHRHSTVSNHSPFPTSVTQVLGSHTAGYYEGSSTRGTLLPTEEHPVVSQTTVPEIEPCGLKFSYPFSFPWCCKTASFGPCGKGVGKFSVDRLCKISLPRLNDFLAKNFLTKYTGRESTQATTDQEELTGSCWGT